MNAPIGSVPISAQPVFRTAHVLLGSLIAAAAPLAALVVLHLLVAGGGVSAAVAALADPYAVPMAAIAAVIALTYGLVLRRRFPARRDAWCARQVALAQEHLGLPGAAVVKSLDYHPTDEVESVRLAVPGALDYRLYFSGGRYMFVEQLQATTKAKVFSWRRTTTQDLLSVAS